ncbi:MAG TPA: hypothetical protein VH572_12375 [Gaiella sp.]
MAVGPTGALVVELVGPPGTGKSTLLAAVAGDRATVVGNPRIRDLTSRAVIAAAALRSLATLVRRRALVRGWMREQVRTMTNVRLWPRLLARGDPAVRLYVFDQGPVFFLTRGLLMNDRLAPWWRETVTAWASILDAVVLLDAPDEILLPRIEGREKPHALKGAGVEEAGASLAGVRRVYEDFVAELAGRPGGPAIMRFDTSRSTLPEIARELLALVDVAPSR